MTGHHIKRLGLFYKQGVGLLLDIRPSRKTLNVRFILLST